MNGVKTRAVCTGVGVHKPLVEILGLKFFLPLKNITGGFLYPFDLSVHFEVSLVSLYIWLLCIKFCGKLHFDL